MLWAIGTKSATKVTYCNLWLGPCLGLQTEMTILDDHTIQIGMCNHGRAPGGPFWKWDPAQLAAKFPSLQYPAGYTKVCGRLPSHHMTWHGMMFSLATPPQQ